MGNAEVMVTARMGVGKKEEGDRVSASSEQFVEGG